MKIETIESKIRQPEVDKPNIEFLYETPRRPSEHAFYIRKSKFTPEEIAAAIKWLATRQPWDEIRAR